jgi:hypothetical protein
MTQKIQLRRGTAADLPTGGTIEGEPRFTTDTGLLYIDDGTKNVLIGGTNNSYEVNALLTYGSGSVYTDATITSALTALGTSDKATLLLTPGTWTISDDITITSNITLKVPAGALISVASGKTLTINGPLEAGLYQIFDGEGTVTLSGNVKEVYPEWFGTNTTPGTTDMTSAINAALASITTGVVRLLPTIYAVSETLNVPTHVHLNGSVLYVSTSGGTIIKWIGGNSDDIIQMTSYADLSDMYIYNSNSSTALTGVNCIGTSGTPIMHNNFTNIHVKLCAAGFMWEYSYYETLRNVNTTYNDIGYDLQSLANAITFFGCNSTTDVIGITDTNGTGASGITWIGGAIENATGFGIKMSDSGSVYSNNWLFDNVYFEGNYQHQIAKTITITNAFINKDGGEGDRPPFDIVSSKGVKLHCKYISNDITELFTISGASGLYDPHSIDVQTTLNQVSIANSLYQSNWLRDGYINRNSYQFVETDWLDASSAQEISILGKGEAWNLEKRYLLDAFVVVDTDIVLDGADMVVSMGYGAGFNNKINHTFSSAPVAATGTYRLDAATGITTTEIYYPATYQYKCVSSAETSGKFKFVFVFI